MPLPDTSPMASRLWYSAGPAMAAVDPANGKDHENVRVGHGVSDRGAWGRPRAHLDQKAHDTTRLCHFAATMVDAVVHWNLM